MPREKAFTCHKCKRSYTGPRCPSCYRKSHGAGRSSRASSARRFGIAGLLSATLAPIAAPAMPPVHYGEARVCKYCGYLTTTHPCSYCNMDE